MFSRFFKNTRFLASCIGHLTPASLTSMMLRQRYPDYSSKQFSICIEGFQRSGNTFFVALFQLWNPTSEIAHHTHLASSPRESSKRAIPTVILLRDPAEAAVSILNWDSRLHPAVVLIAYTIFHKALWRVRERVLVLTFEDVTKHPDRCIVQINKKFDAEFQYGELNDQTTAKVTTLIRNKDRLLARDQFSSSLPNKEKNEARLKYNDLVLNSNHYSAAKEIYQRFAQFAASCHDTPKSKPVALEQ